MVIIALIAYGFIDVIRMLRHVDGGDVRSILVGAGATFLRVNAALLIAFLWTIPAGVAIGSKPKLSRFAQPLIQIAASVPATPPCFPCCCWR